MEWKQYQKQQQQKCPKSKNQNQILKINRKHVLDKPVYANGVKSFWGLF